MSNEKKSTEMRLIQLNNYVRPPLVENKSRNWVLNGRNNDFFDYIIDRNNGSPTNASINSSYTDLIYGQGLTSDNKEGLEILNEMLQPKELRKICYDFQLFNGAKIQKINKKGRKEYPDLYHLPQNLVAPSIENDEYEIDSYWFSKNWNKQYQNIPEEYPSFGTSSEAIEIYDLKPYQAGKVYFSDPTYLAGLPYAELEEEIANYSINHIKNGLSFGYIINIPDGKLMSTEEKDAFEKKIKEKLVGSPNAGKFVLSFNGKDAEITVTPLVINDAHKQWQFLTEESKKQLLTAHKATSPSLVGIVSSSGFSNTADEMDTAEQQLMKRVIKPKQQFITDALEEIMLYYGIELDLRFISLSENTDTVTVNEMDDEIENEEEPLIKRVGLKKKSNLDNFIDEFGEDEDLENWELIDERKVDYEEEKKIDLQLASTGTARPNASSSQDGESDGYNYKVRYQYAPLTVGSDSREFCTKMVGARKIYRKEDIVGNNYPASLGGMSAAGVNKGWGAKGADNYDIFLYKGGGDCHHFWMRKTYRSKAPTKPDAKNPNSEVSVNEARKDGFTPEVNNPKVAKLPTDMPYNGFLPTNKRFQ